LPDEYIKARESDLKRVEALRDTAQPSDTSRKVDELIRETAHGRSSSTLGVFDISSLTDLFS